MEQESDVYLIFYEVVTMINRSIGASGVASQECKEVVSQYGQTILNKFLANVAPKMICSQIGVCTFDGIRGVSAGIESIVGNGGRRSGAFGDAMCNTCEMTVVWMQSQILQNQTQDMLMSSVIMFLMPWDKLQWTARNYTQCHLFPSLLVVKFSTSAQKSTYSKWARVQLPSASAVSLVLMFLLLVDLSGSWEMHKFTQFKFLLSEMSILGCLKIVCHQNWGCFVG